jgi:hypothetical protein
VLAFLRPAGEKQVEISELPGWAQPAFKGMKALNRVQSKVSDCALYSSENMLVCAPTGECFGACCGGVFLGFVCWHAPPGADLVSPLALGLLVERRWFVLL